MLTESMNEFQGLLNLCPLPPKILHKIVQNIFFLECFYHVPKGSMLPNRLGSFLLADVPLLTPAGYHTCADRLREIVQVNE